RRPTRSRLFPYTTLFRSRLRHEPQDIEVPRVLHLGALHRELECVGVAERLLVAPHHLAASLLEARQFLQLPQPQRRLDVAHVVLEAGREHLVAPAPALAVALPGVATHAVQAEHPGAVEEVGRTREHATLAGEALRQGRELA